MLSRSQSGRFPSMNRPTCASGGASGYPAATHPSAARRHVDPRRPVQGEQHGGCGSNLINRLLYGHNWYSRRFAMPPILASKPTPLPLRLRDCPHADLGITRISSVNSYNDVDLLHSAYNRHFLSNPAWRRSSSCSRPAGDGEIKRRLELQRVFISAALISDAKEWTSSTLETLTVGSREGGHRAKMPISSVNCSIVRPAFRLPSSGNWDCTAETTRLGLPSERKRPKRQRLVRRHSHYLSWPHGPRLRWRRRLLPLQGLRNWSWPRAWSKRALGGC